MKKQLSTLWLLQYINTRKEIRKNNFDIENSNKDYKWQYFKCNFKRAIKVELRVARADMCVNIWKLAYAYAHVPTCVCESLEVIKRESKNFCWRKISWEKERNNRGERDGNVTACGFIKTQSTALGPKKFLQSPT